MATSEGPAVPSDEELREALAEASFKAIGESEFGPWAQASGDVRQECYAHADAALTVVRRYADQRAAEEVRRIADNPALSTVTHTANFGLPARVVPVAALYGIADALTREATT